MRIAARVLAVLQGCLAATFILTMAAQAQGVVYPAGSRIGLVPPQGFVPTPAFRGFLDAENKAIIVFFELPPQAFTDIESASSIEDVRKQGILVEKREDLALADGTKAILFSGHDEAGGAKSNKWLLFAPVKDFTAAVNVQIPESAAGVHTDSAIRSTLATIATRAAPVEEQLSLLPFKVSDLSGFKIAHVVENRTLILADDPQAVSDVGTVAQIIVGVAASTPIAANDRATFAREALATLTAFKDLRVTFAEPMRLGGQQAFELRADATHAASGADVSIVQWIRFGTGGVLRIVGVSPKTKWAETFTRFRTVRDSISVN